MARVTGSIVIDRPVEEVFDAVADQTNEPCYNPSMTASRRVTDGQIGVGTHFWATILIRRKPTDVDIEVTRYERPRVFGSRSVMAGSTAAGELRLDPVASGTRLTWDWEVTVAGAARLLGPLVTIVGRRQEHAIWTGLKDWLENDRATTGGP
jgi:Polyketide cyclase / dehydrase and lipid transport